ncbi:ATP-binding protein [Hugenholtzia roseola]|uniref:ATP-binding protein n=1 Tax=Hugenholtzia roseola TaxID=1002 RepID=UPI000404FEBF|nr:ATP-binding protein [Hugenholtzia roseola]
MQNLPLLPLGLQNFEELRRHDMLYVDKTEFLYNILQTKTSFFFLSRPRRFGKSLLISTLKSLFEGRQELFEGLYIHDKIEWQPYPIIHLDFSKMGFKDIGLFASIEKGLLEVAESNGLELKNAGIGLKFSELMEKLHQKTGRQVVILIDEYDKPITDVLEVGKNEKAHEHRETLRQLYSVVKGNSEHIRLFFMTGISRFSRVSIFSDLNNLTDLTLHNDFHNLLGYTQQELETYFASHLQAISDEQGISKEDLLLQVKEWYNGYSWNGRSRVYNPYSILRFLDARVFQNFWFESGTPKFLVKILTERMIYKVGRTTASQSETENFNLDNLNIETLLFQTGYLTIKGYDVVQRLILDYPNKEVEQSMTEHILQGFAHTPKSSIALDITIAILEHNIELLIETVNALYATIPYQLFNQHQEKYFHAVLFLALKLCGFHIESEVSVSTGRLDAVLSHQNRVYIFEFKLNDSAENALKQIHQKGYYKRYQNQDKKIYLLGIGFSAQTKEVSDWKMEELLEN